MLKQFFINRYFHKLCNEKFFKNDDEEIIGKAKDVIQNLKDQIEYVKNPKNEVDEEDMNFVIDEATALINEIDKTYFLKNNVIGLFVHPMAGFYVLQSKKSLFEDLKEYYDELEEK